MITHGEIVLDHDSHTYTDRDGTVYTSVSTLISRYKAPFDRDAIASKIALRDGITVDEVLAEWAKAAPYGTAVHGQLEDFFRGKSGPTNLIGAYTPILETWRKQPVEFMPEKILAFTNNRLALAGTADLLVRDRDGYYSIIDWKTNGKIWQQAFKNKKMKPPLSHLDDCNFIHYSLQLNIYAWMLEQPVKKLSIVHIPRGESTLEVIPVPKLEREVDLILNDAMEQSLPF